MECYKGFECCFHLNLGGGNLQLKYFCLLFTPIPREMIQFDEHIFQTGWFNHHLVMLLLKFPKQVLLEEDFG